MSVEVRYRGRFGNNLFQYVFARLFAEHTGLKLVTPFVENKILEVSPPEEGLIYQLPESVLLDYERADPLLVNHPPGKHIVVSFRQRAKWYYSRRERIKNFFKIQPVKLNDKDLVVNVRGGDYFKFDKGWIIHPKWYLDIISKEKFDKLYVVTDDTTSEENRKILSCFGSYNPEIVHFEGEPERDFHFLRSFDRMVLANSTFSWWAAFFSEGSRFYAHRRWIDYDFSDFPRSLRGEKLGNLSLFPKSISIDGPFLGETV